MSAAAANLLLQRVPDARRAPWPLLPPVFFPYAALMLGAAVASVLALYNALALRRARPALVAMALGLVGWLGFGLVYALAVRGGLGNVAVALLPARLFNVGLGVLLAWSQWAHVRGHGFLEGRTVPLMPAVLAAFAAVLAIPTRVLLVLQGLWALLLG